MPGLNPEEKQQKAVFGDEQTQKMLNEPVKAPAGEGNANKEFLEMLIRYIDEGKIDLYKPSTLLKTETYEKLDDAGKGKADFETVNMLGVIREIDELYRNGFQDSYQMENLVERLRLQKERTEEVDGDIFII